MALHLRSSEVVSQNLRLRRRNARRPMVGAKWHRIQLNTTAGLRRRKARPILVQRRAQREDRLARKPRPSLPTLAGASLVWRMLKRVRACFVNGPYKALPHVRQRRSATPGQSSGSAPRHRGRARPLTGRNHAGCPICHYHVKSRAEGRRTQHCGWAPNQTRFSKIGSTVLWRTTCSSAITSSRQ